MNFWNWLNKNEDKRFSYSKRVSVILLVFIIVPMLIYFIVIWDPNIGYNEDGEPVKLGLYVIIGLYWLGAYLTYKRHEAKSKLNKLLDRLLDKDDEETKHFFEVIERRRKIIKNENSKLLTKEGEKRTEWFGIY